MNRSARTRLFEQLATMTSAGIPLRQASRTLAESSGKRETKLLAQGFEEGLTAQEAFVKAKFSPFETRLVAAGERSARLEEVFTQLGVYWRQQEALASHFVRSLLYPVLVLHAAAVLSPLVDSFSTGTFEVKTFAYGVVTRLVLMYVLAAVAWLLLRLSWSTEAGQLFWMRIPVIGNVWRSTYAYRWVLVMKIEYAAGLSLSEAVADAWEATGFALRHTRAAEGRRLLLEGETLAATYGRWTNLLPREWQDYLATAEVSGKIEETLDFLHDQALGTWRTWQAALSEWMPRVAYSVIVTLAMAQMGYSFYKIMAAQGDLWKILKDD